MNPLVKKCHLVINYLQIETLCHFLRYLTCYLTFGIGIDWKIANNKTILK